MFPFNYNNGIEIIQAPGYVIVRLEMVHEARVIPVDGRAQLDPAIKQWMGESHSVALNSDDSVTLRLIEQLDDAVDSVVGRHRKELDRRVSDTRGGQQYVMGLLVQVPNADTHEFS